MSDSNAGLAVLISGRGSNMIQLLDAAERGDINANLCVVISDNVDAAGLSIARERGVHTAAIVPSSFGSRQEWEAALRAELIGVNADLIALAGFMRVLSAPFCASWTGKLLNIHPSLLPRHKGLDTHAKALQSGDTHAGCSVHYVTAELDGGPVIAQSSVQIETDDTPESLAKRVLKLEHLIYPQVVAWCASKTVTLQAGAVYFDDMKLSAPKRV